MEILAIAGTVVFYLVLIAGLLIIPLGFPGTWVMVIAAIVYALVGNLNPPAGNEIWPIVWLVLMAGLGELIELGVRIIGSKAANVPNGAIVAAIVGGLVGVIIGVPIFLIGSLFGLLIGVFAGAFIYALVTTKEIHRALWMALATTTSQVVALFAKTCIGIAMIVYISVELF